MKISELTKEDINNLTPTMKQYIDLTKEYSDTVLFYRIGDFYEFFFETAEEMSKVLELALTSKAGGLEEKIPMAGIPSSFVDSYIIKLLNLGYKVSFCEQIETFKNGKKEVLGREVVKVITPGTIISNDMLDSNKSNYIMSIYLGEEKYSIAAADISTGMFFASSFEASFSRVLDELSKFRPTEIIVTDNITDDEIFTIKELFTNIINIKEKEFFDGEFSKEYTFNFTKSVFENIKGKEKKVDKDKSKDIYDSLKINDEIKKAVKGIDKYIELTQKIKMTQLNDIEIYFPEKYMAIDYASRKNLEINERMQDGRKKGSLYGTLDFTKTAMGSRMLSTWINSPLVDKFEIEGRLDAVEELIDNIDLMHEIENALKYIHDIERLISKVSNATVNARDLIALKKSIGHLVELKLALSNGKSHLIKRLFSELDILDDIYTKLDEVLLEDPPIQITEGGIINPEYSEELFKLLHMEEINSEKILKLELEEKEKTNISLLKVGFHRNFGYYIEVTKANIDKVPQDRYFLKQTLKNQNRYITAELKVLEDEILGASEKSKSLEYEIFNKLREEINAEIGRIQKAAKIIANADTIFSLAVAAIRNRYVKPEITNNMQGIIDIKGGRHPIVERISKEQFVENDTYLDNFKNTVMLITGPNMSGKSTYMRQVALITLMAQIGSFVPADEARINVVDKIFTRIGASDDLGMGKSTFMVEMTELANILNNATSKSLILLDEVGRGTSTYDGMSIAEAVIEEIADKEKIGAKTLFATHYHELTKLEERIPSVKNYHVTAEVIGKDVFFLRKLAKGGSSESYGIHVAKLAGIKPSVLKRAEKILSEIEVNQIFLKKAKEKEQKNEQVAIEDMKYASLIQKIQSIDINNMTPLEALKELGDIKGMF